MSYLVIAYPELTIDDFNRIQNYRRINDTLFYNVVNPHFTFVFPVLDISPGEFVNEVRDKCEPETRIDFAIRCATIRPPDLFSDYFHALLVPDEGYSRIVKLHDKLYSGRLKANLELGVDFVPHLAIGNSKDKSICKRMVDEWNREEFSISGSIKSLSIISYKNDVVTTIDELKLRP